MFRNKPIWTKTFGLCYKMLPESTRTYYYTYVDGVRRPKFQAWRGAYFKSPRQTNKSFEPHFRHMEWIKGRGSIWTNEK